MNPLRLNALALLLVLTAAVGTRAADDAQNAQDETQRTQEVGGASFTLEKVLREGDTYVLELTAKSLGKDINASCIGSASQVTLGTGKPVASKYVKLGESSGPAARATLLAGHDISLTVKWNLAGRDLKELPRAKIRLRLDRKDYDLSYKDLKVQ